MNSKVYYLFIIANFWLTMLLRREKEAIKEELDSKNVETDKEDNVYKQIASAYNMGTSFYMSDQFKKAIPYLDKAMQLAETLPEKEKYIYKKFITWRVCFTYAQAGKNKEAVKIMEQLINMVEQKYKNITKNSVLSII